MTTELRGKRINLAQPIATASSNGVPPKQGGQVYKKNPLDCLAYHTYGEPPMACVVAHHTRCRGYMGDVFVCEHKGPRKGFCPCCMELVLEILSVQPTLMSKTT